MMWKNIWKLWKKKKKFFNRKIVKTVKIKKFQKKIHKNNK